MMGDKGVGVGTRGDRKALAAGPLQARRQINVKLFGLLLLFHFFKFAALTFDLLLLLLDLTLGLLLLVFLVLHLVANRITAHRAHRTADRRSGARMADGRTDYGAGSGTQYTAAQSSLLTSAERLPAASDQNYRQHQRANSCPD